MSTLLLERFRLLFFGTEYHHRDSTLGDQVAQFVYEDLYHLGLSSKFCRRVQSGEAVLNVQNRTHGVQHRRGDGTFGTLIPGETPISDVGFEVQRGPIATIQIGVEVKIISKAMIRQIGRVISDLGDQVRQFRRSNPEVICLGIVGVNHASRYRSVDGTREYLTTGSGKHLHPIQEAPEAVRRLDEVRDTLDELVVLRFRAPNIEPFTFEWVDDTEARRNYSSALVRLASAYEQRF